MLFVRPDALEVKLDYIPHFLATEENQQLTEQVASRNSSIYNVVLFPILKIRENKSLNKRNAWSPAFFSLYCLHEKTKLFRVTCLVAGFDLFAPLLLLDGCICC